MKRILTGLVMAMLVLSVPAFAEVTVSGEFDYSAMINSDEVAGEFDKVELDITADVDENNTFELELEDKQFDNDLDDSAAFINYAQLSTDWSGVLGIDIVGIDTIIGYTDFGGGDNSYITGYEFENYGGTYTDKEAGAKLSLTLAEGMFTPYAAYMFDNYDKYDDADDDGIEDAGEAEEDEQEILMGVKIDFAPFWADVYYLTARQGDVDGIFGTEVNTGLNLGNSMMLDLVASYEQNLADDLAAGEEYLYGAGAAFTYDAFKVGVAMSGNDDQAAEYLGLDAAYTVSEMVTLKAGSAFYLGDDDTIDEFLNLTMMAEVAASENVTYTVGYVVADGFGDVARFTAGPETVAADGGVFVGCAVNF